MLPLTIERKGDAGKKKPETRETELKACAKRIGPTNSENGETNEK